MVPDVLFHQLASPVPLTLIRSTLILSNHNASLDVPGNLLKYLPTEVTAHTEMHVSTSYLVTQGFGSSDRRQPSPLSFWTLRVPCQKGEAPSF